jgi:competence protein ComEC
MVFFGTDPMNLNERSKRFISAALLAALGVAAVFVWFVVFHYEALRHAARVHVFDVGQGDGIFLELPDGNQILVDGGPDKTILSKLASAMLPWDRSIDLLILTHPHADHLDGLFEVAKRYRIGMVLESGSLHTIPEYAEWHALLRERGVPIIVARAGQRIAASDSIVIDVLAPADSMEGKSLKNVHDAMIVVKFSYGSTSVMLMGDAEKKIEYALMRTYSDLRADVLKVGHHGSKTSTSDDFLKAVSPRYAVISVGRKNRYGHPHQDVIDRHMITFCSFNSILHSF